MLIAQVFLQVCESGAVKIAEPTLVRFDVVVPHHVQAQVFLTTAGEGASVAAEDDAL